MRILHIVPTYFPALRYGGPILSVHGLCKALVELGHEVEVYTTNVNGPSNSDVSLETPVDINGVKVWYFPSQYLRRLYYSPLMQKALVNNIKQFDLLHLHSIYLWPTYFAASEARRKNIPYIVSPRGMLVKDLIKRKSHFLKSLWLQLIEKKNLENAGAIHATTGLEAREVQRFGFKLPSVFVVPNGVEADLLNHSRLVEDISPEIQKLLNKKPMILFLGRINWKKGLDRLIPALSYVPEAHLVIAGNDEENYTPILKKLAESYEVSKRINFVGPAYGEDKIALLKNATVVALPSYSENFGNVVLEAMAVGCPVVVTPEVGLAEVVKKSGSGLVVDGNPEILGKSLKDLLADEDKRQLMGKAGKATVQNRFTWNLVAKQMEKVYQNSLKEEVLSK